MKPLIDDFGEGYMAFCPNCFCFLGWEMDGVEHCPNCGAKMEGIG